MANSINTNVAAYFAQGNISIASNNAASSVSRLSSGNRIVKASDDVAALSIGTSLQTGISALRVALTNASQGTSLLQVADGGLSQVTSILQRQKAIALQAASGSLTDSDRAFLDIEFQELTKQVDSIVSSTTFNGVKLFDGSLSTSAAVVDKTTAATAGSLSTTFADNIRIGETIVINGTTLTAIDSGATATGAQFKVGGDITATLANLASRLNDLADNASYNTTIGAAKYSSTSQTLTATARSGGSLSNAFTFGAPVAISTAATSLQATSGSASVIMLAADTSGYVVGQSIIVKANTALTLGGLGGIGVGDLRGIITAISANTSITFTAQDTATANATSATATTFGLDTVNGGGGINSEVNQNGGSVGSTFNLFATTTGFTSKTTVISAATSGATTPFQNGDTFTATVGGVTSTLATIATSETLESLVNNINSNSAASGFKAALVYDGSTYNIRLSTSSVVGNILIDGGANFGNTGVVQATNLLTGQNLSGTANNIGSTAGTDFSGKSLISTGYIDLFGASGSTPITAASTADVEAATIALADATTPFVLGSVITANINGQSVAISNPIASGQTLDQIVLDINSKSTSTGVYALALTNPGNTASNIRLFFTTPTPGSDPITVSVPNAGTAVSVLNTLTTTGATAGLTITNTASLAGGVDNGLGQGNTAVTGTVGDNILTAIGTTKANASVLLTAVPTAGQSITVGGQAFYFTANTAGAPNEILIGASIQETVNNAVASINNYVSKGYALGTAAYELGQLDITATSNSIVFTGKGLGAVKTLTGGNSAITVSLTGTGALVGGTLNNNSTTFGVDVTGINNIDFQGKISGFEADYVSNNTADLSVKIGDFTYTAKSANVVVTSDSRIRFYSDTVDGKSGGYFDVQLKANNVTNPVDTQAKAEAVAARLDGAFSSLSFLQKREISSYTGTGTIVANGSSIGSLTGTKVSAQLASFDNLTLSDAKILAPSGSNLDAKITLVIGGVEFSTSPGIGNTLAKNQTYKLTSAEDANQFVTFTTGDTAINLSSSDNALAAEAALKAAFGAVSGASALSFQIGSTSADSLSVSLGSAKTEDLFKGVELSVATQDDADIASAALDDALAEVTSLRASVGALQSRFNFASANIQTSVQNLDAARGSLLDTDVATESTAYATSQVKLQAGISVLAQANQQLQALLKLIG